MTNEPSLNIRLFGTEEPAAEPEVLRAGSLTAELDAGNLRHIRLNGVEVMRAISFIIRDKNWATYNPTISKLAINETGKGFRVTYSALASDDRQLIEQGLQLGIGAAFFVGTQTEPSYAELPAGQQG